MDFLLLFFLCVRCDSAATASRERKHTGLSPLGTNMYSLFFYHISLNFLPTSLTFLLLNIVPGCLTSHNQSTTVSLLETNDIEMPSRVKRYLAARWLQCTDDKIRMHSGKWSVKCGRLKCSIELYCTNMSFASSGEPPYSDNAMYQHMSSCVLTCENKHVCFLIAAIAATLFIAFILALYTVLWRCMVSPPQR